MLDLSFRTGQQVLVLYNRAYARQAEPEPKPAAITKVGKRWATLGDGRHAPRFDMQTLALDGGDMGSPGRVYLSAEHLELDRAKAHLWQDLAGRFQYGGRRPPSQLHLGDLVRFHAALAAAEQQEPEND